MEIITMKLVDLVKPEKNVRIHTEQQLKEFQRSVKMFGQIRPIVVDENNVILAGNGLYETLIAMGKETADVYKYDNLTENQKKKLMIADNKIFSLGIENLDTLNSFLEDLQGDLDIPGFDEDILKQMVSEAEDVTEKLSEYGTLDDEEIQSICFKLRLLPYATYNFPILFSNLPVVPIGQHFLLSCSTSHSGSFFKWCHKMKPACFEFVSIKSKAVSEDVSHNCNFLFWCVSIH